MQGHKKFFSAFIKKNYSKKKNLIKSQENSHFLIRTWQVLEKDSNTLSFSKVAPLVVSKKDQWDNIW